MSKSIDAHLQRYNIANDRPNRETSIERLMRMALDGAGIDYTTQGHVGRYRPDFIIDEWALIIECDGPIHQTSAQQVKDRRKDEVYRRAGFKTYRFTHLEIHQSAVACVQRIVSERKKP